MPTTTKDKPSSSSLHYYACGEIDQDLSTMFRGREKQKRTFPAGVFLFKHASGENVLFDTGYRATRPDCGLPGYIYHKLLPPRVERQDEIRSQLLNDGIEPRSIGRVVLSHLHPDHIGGVQFFPDAEFVMSRGAADSLRKPKLREGILRGLLPDWFDSASKLILDGEQLASAENEFVHGYDLLGDQSFLLTELPGHARGQLGALVLNKLLLGADASWGKDLVGNSTNMRPLAKAANYDMNAYRVTDNRLQELDARGIELCFSHDTYAGKVLLA